MSTPTDRPNVVVVHPHNLGRYLGCYDRPIETPNADALAEQGVRFTDYFCTAPHCSPSRGSMWTGTYPHVNGLVGLAHLGWRLDDNRSTLIDHLNDAGYRTHLFGLQHVYDDPEEMGFDHVEGSTHSFNVDEPAEEVAEDVEAFFESGRAEGDEPFFASVGFSEVHRQPLVDRCLDCGWTFDLPGYESDDPEEVEPLPYLPDGPGHREDLANFHGMVRAVDDGLGRVIDAIDEAGHREDTLVIFTTDHGIGFPRAMGTCYDPGVETFLLARWPGAIEPGRTDDHLLSNVDFTPTILDLLDLDPPSDISGRSFAPLLTGDGTYEPREEVYTELTWHSKYMPSRAVRTDRYKYVRTFGDQPRVYIPAPLFTAPAGLEVRNEFYGEQRPEEELYDLETDPHEKNNLADDPAHQETLVRLRERVEEWMESTDDRLLEGDWPPTSEQDERVKKSPWIPRT
jgi:arylsulfatase A-like enzyme